MNMLDRLMLDRLLLAHVQYPYWVIYFYKSILLWNLLYIIITYQPFFTVSIYNLSEELGNVSRCDDLMSQYMFRISHSI